MKSNSSILMLLLSVGLFFSFTNPQYSEMKELNAVSNNYKEVLRNASRIAEMRDSLLVAYDSFPQADLDRINKVLPDKVDTVRLALDLDGIASRHGISISSITASTESSQEGDQIMISEYAPIYEKAIVTLSFVSNYENFMALLADLERNLRIMDVHTTSFATSETGLYEHEVSVETYWLK